ncbi:uncharacterized protein LOC109724548 isoform X3 [Ananas comosus]|uniref:Uncharacterized protein LOC109724548 isoform X2 n=1 Tax=Ananas comosus TaxID=4615 RepID=A0A6P5GMG9_ANACO|nr:uncharacterized protein LOC109724548 isoform X2 [Ananas comosus]XP_020108987.1 uncharacterized protein LOC109724548 isoform X3 [Ananas comosus]
MAPKRKRCGAGTGSARLPARELDFRAPGDDAWYSVRLLLEKDGDGDGDVGGALRVMYREFPEAYDERYYYYHRRSSSSSSPAAAASASGPENKSKNLSSLKEAEEFRARFRPPSVQLQDSQCWKLQVGTTVCAAHAFGDCDVRFYDATIDSVFFSTHKFDRGEDVCTCKFAVKWLHGPLSGEKTTLHIGNICLVPPLIGQDPVLDEFLEKVRKSVEVGSNIVDQMDGHLPSTPRQDIESITEKQDSSFSRFPDEIPGSVNGCTLKTPLDSLHNYEDVRLSKRTIVLGNNSTGQVFSRQVFEHNDDFRVRLASQKAPKESYFSFWIENLENDLSPSIVREFISKEVHVPSQVILYPGLLSYSSCKGSIFVRAKELAEKLFDFLFNPAHMIVSTKGS